jgi:hypothetical protein
MPDGLIASQAVPMDVAQIRDRRPIKFGALSFWGRSRLTAWSGASAMAPLSGTGRSQQTTRD